ncbi:Kelch repeat-containing protein 3 [Cyphellophora attinorum]|uniref:Kelch repeat-containing protein 3 n=1 Tax=Cyphellophora attinorum TaxID=1664694 RepID=A0A0N0NS96_9EURO|nr:Kelch repeat-containing protein 3 [Phialophora attinorum]KPI45749.1 Kelch repeat-containing protein 3 [Phialophora attinorum]
MAKGKDKKAKAEQKAQKAAKQAKKAAKSEKKGNAKQADQDSDAEDDVDLDAVLAAYAEEQARFLKVTEERCAPPPPRSSCTIVASPSNRNELFIFGGELMDTTGLVRFYNDLYVYNISRGEFSQISSPNSPAPRSGHAWCRSGNTGKIYLFGGEFSSPKQGIFYHFNSMHMLDPDTREWSLIEPRGKVKGPPSRSGHRMTYWKNYIILFGGFQDTSQQTRYLNDTWMYDCRENTWHEMKVPSVNSQKPDPRSSFSFLPHESGAVLFGGYSRVKTSTNKGKTGKGGPQRDVLKPFIHQDTWFLRLTPPAEDAPSGTAPAMRWERRKRPANAPNPPRTGSTMAYHKGRGIFFGGVHDVEESEEGIDSEFFNELLIWNIDRNRFFPLALRRPKAGGKKQVQAARGRHRGKADEEELLRNLAALETKGSIAGADDMDLDAAVDTTAEVSDSKKDFAIKFELPHPRFNAQLTVQDDTLYIFGGTLEKQDIEITFSDLYAIDLGKLDGVKELHYEEPINWNATIEPSDDEDEDEDMDYSDEEEVEDEDSTKDTTSVDTPSTPATEPPPLKEEVETEHKAQEDPRPFPRPFESLRDFFARTSEEWQRLTMAKQPAGSSSDHSVKELRKKGFSDAEERWWDAREEIMALEDEQEAAGIGEVVNLADRQQDAGAGRRR